MKGRRARCLIVQLGDLSETIQSLMALKAVEQLYPEVELHMIVKDTAAQAVRRVSWIKGVKELPVSRLIQPVVDGEKLHSDALRELALWFAPIVKQPWEFVINWTYSDSSSYLSALLPAAVKLGYNRRKDASFYSGDDWSLYVQAIVKEGLRQNIHLTDIFTTQLLTNFQINLGEPKERGSEPVTSKCFFDLNEESEAIVSSRNNLLKKWILIDLSEVTRWKAQDVGDLASQILKHHRDYHVFLAGRPNQVGFSEQILTEIEKNGEDRGRVVSFVGEQDFDLLASAVSRSQWVIAGGGAVTQMSSVLGTRLLELKGVSENLFSMGPYGNGHYVMESLNSDAVLNSRAVYGVWSYAMSEWSHQREIALEDYLKAEELSSSAESFQVYRSRIRPSIDGGGVVYEPMIERSLQIVDWVSKVTGELARSWYCGWTSPVGQELKRSRLSPSLLNELRGLEEDLDKISELCGNGSSISTLLAEKAKFLKSDHLMNLDDQAMIRRLGSELSEVDQSIEAICERRESLSAFSNMTKVMMHNLNGRQLSEIARSAVQAYRLISEGVSLYKDWLHHTLSLAKPRSVKPALIELKDMKGDLF